MLMPVENGIDLSKISSSGSTLEIHFEDFDDLLSSNKNENSSAQDTVGEATNKTFEEIANEMTIVDKYGYVKKKIIEEGGGDVIDDTCTVGIAYSGYFEGEFTPFDLKPAVKPLNCNMKDNSLLCGLQTAVLSMRVGEVSMFLLSYKVMYGEMGNPPKVKPKADCLFYVKLIRSRLTPDIRDSLEEPNMFTRMLKESKILYKNGSSFFNNSNIPMAIRCFNKAVNIMHRTRLANEEEEKKQEEFLLKVYLNLAICYNRSKNPRRACCMCNEINRLTNIWQNGKALFQNAKALRMIGDFKGSKTRITRVMQLCPDMRNEIQEEMDKILAQEKAYEQSRLLALKIVQQDQSSEIRNIVSEEFKTEVSKLVKQFARDPDICKITLPKSLNFAELKYVEEVAKDLKITCATVKKNVSLDKMPALDHNKPLFED